MNSTNASDNSDNFSTHSLILNDNPDQTLNSTTNNSKYDKLVQDFLKLRTKLTILKKAYVDLSEQTTQKDQIIRKNEQDIEGLNFRNQQLTSRVEILQRELDTLKSSLATKSTNLAQSTSTSNLNIIQPSLSPSSVSLSSSSTSTSSLQSNTKAYDVLTEELQRKINENASLHSRLNELETELKANTLKLETRILDLENEKQTLENNFEKCDFNSKSLIEKLQNDKIKLEVNLIQIENEFKKFQLNPKIEINNNNNSTNNSEIKYDLNVFEKQIDNLCKIYSNLNDLFNLKKLNCSHLNECNQYLRESLQPILFKHTDKIDSKDLNLKLDSFFKFNSALFNQLIMELFVDSDSNLDIINKKLKIYLNKLNTLFFKDNFSSRLIHLVCFILFNNSNTYQMNAQFNQIFASNLTSFNDILDKLLFVLNEKLSLQYSLNYASNLNTIDELMVSYLTQMKQDVFDLIKLVNMSSITDLCVKYFKINNSIKSNDKEIDEIRASLDNKELELKQLKDKIQKDSLEHDKLKLKYDQLVSVFSQLQAKEQQQQELIQKLNQQHQLQEQSHSQNITYEIDNLKIDFYIKKINSLNQQLESTDSKCLFFYEEVKSLMERLKIQTDLNNLQEIDLNEVRDQLERTRSSYEIQMSTMSDHLIEMNDRMARQADENEKLKHELTSLTQQQQQNKTFNESLNDNSESFYYETSEGSENRYLDKIAENIMNDEYIEKESFESKQYSTGQNGRSPKNGMERKWKYIHIRLWISISNFNRDLVNKAADLLNESKLEAFEEVN